MERERYKNFIKRGISICNHKDYSGSFKLLIYYKLILQVGKLGDGKGGWTVEKSGAGNWGSRSEKGEFGHGLAD